MARVAHIGVLNEELFSLMASVMVEFKSTRG